MIAFAPAKINIGLYVTEKRADGYHNIETIFYPIPVYDVIEILPSEEFEITEYGFSTGCKTEQNICYKAWKLLHDEYSIDFVCIHLIKNIPVEAGLGGGSSNGTTVLKILNNMFKLGLNKEQLKQYSEILGSDCPFFIDADPSYGFSRGEHLEKIHLNLTGKTLILFKPPQGISTSEAFKRITPKKHENLLSSIQEEISMWKNNIENVFEPLFEKRYPEISLIKEKLYKSGADYVQMSGSGSAYYAIYDKIIDFKSIIPEEWYFRDIAL